MSWPDQSEYFIAVQNPSKCFVDSELNRGKTIGNTLGLPKAISGNFAVVFQLACANSRYAVKCFTRQLPDLQGRYRLVSQHLTPPRPAAMVDFKYLNLGIRIREQYYPVVKMQWVEGDSLPRYIERHLDSPRHLLQLAHEWRKTITSLRGIGIAHGDLQNGNVMIVGDQIRLVDYDGMFVPALRGKPPEENGQPHFQHPRRTRDDYGENVDNFSALVIYLSILAVMAEPQVWKDFHSDENLIFSDSDFKAIKQTGVWQRLRLSPDPEVRRLVNILAGCCLGPVSAVPILETVVNRTSPHPPTVDWDKLPKAPISVPPLPRPRLTVEDWKNLEAYLSEKTAHRPKPSTPHNAVRNQPPAKSPPPAKHKANPLRHLAPPPPRNRDRWSPAIGISVLMVSLWLIFSMLTQVMESAEAVVRPVVDQRAAVTLVRPSVTRVATRPSQDVVTAAQQVVRRFYDLRSEVGASLDESTLDTVLRGPALEAQRQTLTTLKENNCYWTFRNVDLEFGYSEIKTPSQVELYVVVREDADLYCNGQHDPGSYTHDQRYGARFIVENIAGEWYITDKMLSSQTG